MLLLLLLLLMVLLLMLLLLLLQGPQASKLAWNHGEFTQAHAHRHTQCIEAHRLFSAVYRPCWTEGGSLWKR
jgi:hypothetical protein